MLNVIILFPSFIQFFHVLENHEHIVCNEDSSHFHETIVDCEICDFNYTPLVYELIPVVNNNTSNEYVLLNNNSYNYLNSYKHQLSNNLRGPPEYS